MKEDIINLEFDSSNFEDFVLKLKDLSSIDDVIKIKIDSSKIFMYSMIATEGAVLALKSYTLETDKYFTNFESDYSYDYVISGSVKFVKNLNFFDTTKKIKLDMRSKSSTEDDIMNVRSGLFSNSRLKITCVGSEPFKIKDISIKTLESMLDVSKSLWGFRISSEDFSDVKKLSNINSEDRILDINVVDGVVTVSESSKWELIVDEVETQNKNITFIKKYLSSIDDKKEFIKFDIFNNFILVKDDVSNLMMAFEQNFN